MSYNLPDAKKVKQIHYELVHMFEGTEDPIEPAGVKNQGLLESACGRPLTGYGGAQKYISLEAQVGALFHSLIKNHAFHNGNKRTAVASMIVALYLNKRSLRERVKDRDIANLAVRVAMDVFPHPGCTPDQVVFALEDWIKGRSEPYTVTLSEITVYDFVERCRQAGATCKETKGSYRLSYRQNTIEGILRRPRSVKISAESPHRKLPGKVQKTYLMTLGLIGPEANYIASDFRHPIDPEQTQIRRFRGVYTKLARK